MMTKLFLEVESQTLSCGDTLFTPSQNSSCVGKCLNKVAVSLWPWRVLASTYAERQGRDCVYIKEPSLFIELLIFFHISK